MKNKMNQWNNFTKKKHKMKKKSALNNQKDFSCQRMHNMCAN
jgi:hypothetical protein